MVLLELLRISSGLMYLVIGKTSVSSPLSSFKAYAIQSASGLHGTGIKSSLVKTLDCSTIFLRTSVSVIFSDFAPSFSVLPANCVG